MSTTKTRASDISRSRVVLGVKSTITRNYEIRVSTLEVLKSPGLKAQVAAAAKIKLSTPKKVG